MDKIRLVIVDDHPLFREGVVAILGTDPSLEFVGQGATAGDATHLAQSLQPDIIILDINMPGGGIIAAQSIADDFPEIRIVVLTGSTDEDDLLNSLQAGAQAYVLKGVTARELVNILHRVQEGERYVTPSLAANLHFEIKPPETEEKHKPEQRSS